jgi:hypothetical protein
MPRVIAIEPHDGHMPGTEYPVGDKAARQLIEKGLAKMAGQPMHNKMLDDSTVTTKVDRRDPTGAAGEVLTSSASPAGQASPGTTSTSSDAGATDGTSSPTGASQGTPSSSSSDAPQTGTKPASSGTEAPKTGTPAKKTGKKSSGA